MAQFKPLRDLVAGWPQDGPRTLVDLVRTDPQEIRALYTNQDLVDLILEVRQQAVDVFRAADAPAPLPNPDSVFEALEKNHVRTIPNFWTTYALDAKKQRIYRPGSKGRSAYSSLYLVGKHAPWASELHKELPIPRGGGYLLLYGGKPTPPDSVCERLITLIKETAVVDILWWDYQSRSLWSVKAGFGGLRKGADKWPMPENLKPVFTALNEKGGSHE